MGKLYRQNLILVVAVLCIPGVTESTLCQTATKEKPSTSSEESLFGHYCPALINAATRGNIGQIRYLFQHGVDPNGQDDNGYCALLVAVDGRHPKTARYLLAHKANPNVQTRHYNYSPLMLAAKNGDTSITRLLLRYGADTALEDLYGKTAIDYAKDHKHWAVRHLLESSNHHLKSGRSKRASRE